MEKPGMFRQTPGVVRRGITERAENPNPSPVVPGIERPVWRSFVGNEAFQKVNAPLVRDEQRRMAEAARPDPRPRVAAAPRAPKWKAGIGLLQVEHPDGLVEDLDPESLLDDPEVGDLAAESLWKRDVSALAKEEEDLRFRLRDPRSKVSGLSESEREEFSLMAPDDPRRGDFQKRADADAARTAEEQRLYDIEAKKRALASGGIAAWRAGREASKGVQERAGKVAAKELEIDAAEESAVAEERALDEKMRRGVSGAEVGAIQAKRAEIAAARQGMEAARGAVGVERQGVAAAARREADGMDGKPSVPARDAVETALQASGLFGSATAAMSGAADKGIRRKPDGTWDLPLMMQEQKNPAMQAIGGAAVSAGQKLGARLDSGGMAIDEKAIRKVFDDVQRAGGFSDDEISAAWNDLGVVNRKFEDGEKARVLSDGQLVPNAGDSDWLDTAKARVIVESSAASPESKAATLENLPAIQEQIAAAKAKSYEEAVKERVFVDEKIPLFSKFAAENPGALPDQVRAFEAQHMNSRGVVEKWRDAKYASFIAGWNKADATIMGAAALGLDKLTEGERVARNEAGFEGEAVGPASLFLKAANFTRGEASRLTTSSGLIKDATGADGLVGALIEELPSIAIQSFLTKGMGGVVGAATGSARLGQASAALTAYTTAGAQSTGATYASEIAAGTDPAKAREKALKAGANTALITAVFGSGAMGGVERVAVGRAASMTLRDVAAMARQKGVLNVAKSPELRKFAAGVVKSAGGEATEEGLDELIGAFLTADPDTNLADAWSNAVEAAKVGGFIGGAIDVAAGAAQDSEWQKQVLESTPEDRAARVNAEIAAVNPTAAPAAPEEVASAEEIVGPFGAGPDAQALEAEIAAADPEEAEVLRGKRGRTSAEEVAAGVEIVREIAAEEAEVEEVVAEAEAGLAEAMALGDPVALEQATAGVAVARAGRSKPARARGVLKIARGETLETLTAAEVRSLGVTREGKPMKEEELAAVGLASPAVEVLADGSLIVLDEALAELSPTARKRVKMGEAEARKKAVERQSAPAAESPGVLGSAGQKFTVTGRSGTVVEVEAADEAAAQVAGAEALPMGETVAGFAPVGGAAPAPAANLRPAIVKRIARLKKSLGANATVSTDPAARATATDAGVVINPSRLVDEATANGLTETEADEWIQGVIDEELRHFAHLQASREIWKRDGTKKSLEAWREEYYGMMWLEEFAGERGETVAKLYGASFDALPNDEKAMEGLRMMSQQLAAGNPTEVAKLWTNAGPRIIAAIREALKALKAMVSELSPALKAEIAAIEAQLSKYEQNTGTVPDRGEKPAEIREAGGNDSGSRTGGDREATGGREADAGAGGEVLPAGKGSRVSFTRGGERRSGVVVAVATNGTLLVNLDGGGRLTVSPDEVEAAPVAAVSSFTTAKGSTYTVNADGSTARNKKFRPEHGEKEQGPQRPSDKTIYLDERSANALAPPRGEWRLVDHGDGTASLITHNGERWGVAPSQRKIPYSTEPGIDLFPLELWDKDDAGYKLIHHGNKITAFGQWKADSPADATPKGSEPAAGDFKVGDEVTWNADSGQVFGQVYEVIPGGTLKVRTLDGNSHLRQPSQVRATVKEMSSAEVAPVAADHQRRNARRDALSERRKGAFKSGKIDAKENKRVADILSGKRSNFPVLTDSELDEAEFILAAAEARLPQPTFADWQSREKFVGEDFAGPPNSIVIQLRDENSVPLAGVDPIIHPLESDMESTVDMAQVLFYRNVPGKNASPRESLIKLIGPDGRAFAQLRNRDGKLEAARQDDLEKARAAFSIRQGKKGKASADVLPDPTPAGAAPALKVGDMVRIRSETAPGDSLPDGWALFGPQSGTIGIPRAEMPQIDSGDRSAALQFLRARGMDYREETVTAESILPTQAEFSREKVQAAKNREGGERALLVAEDNHLIDGHHQWLTHGRRDKVRIIRVLAPIREVLAAVKEMPSADTDSDTKSAKKPASPTAAGKTSDTNADTRSYDELVRDTYAGADARRKFDDLKPAIQSYATDFASSGSARTPAGVKGWLAGRGVVGDVGRDVVAIIKALPLVDAIEAEKSALRELSRRQSAPAVPSAEVAPGDGKSKPATKTTPLEVALKKKEERERMGGTTGEWKPVARDETPVPDGSVRFYHAGSAAAEGERRWLSPNREWATNFRAGRPVFYVDIPVDDPQLRKSYDDTDLPASSPFINFEADESTSSRLVPITTPADVLPDPTPAGAAPALKVGDMVRIRSETAPGGFMGPYKIWRITGNTAKVEGPVRSLSFNLESLERVEAEAPPAKPDLEQLSKDRAKIIAAVADVPAVVNAIRNTPQNAQYTVAEEVRRVLVDMLNAGDLSVASYDYFAKNVEKAEWVKTVVRDVEKGMVPDAPAATGMIHAEGGKFYADTSAMNRINGIPGLKHDHVGYGDFETITPRGKVNWFRRDDMTVEGMTGRVHELSGTPEAVASLVESLKTAGVAESAPAAPAPPSAPPLSAGDSQILGALDGLFAAPLRENYDKDIPSDRFMALMGAANTLVGEGVTTPEALAAKFSTLAEGRLKPFTQKVWFALKSAGAKGASEPDWAAIYGGIDNATTGEQGVADDSTQQPGDRGSADPAGAEESSDTGTGESDLPGVRGGTGAKAGSGAVRPGNANGGGRGNGKRGSSSGSGADADRPASDAGAAEPDRGSSSPDRGEAGRTGVRVSRPAPGTPEANFVIEDSFSMPSGPKARIDANLAAIALLRQIEQEERNATAKEKATLSKYSGWGSFKNAFNQVNQSRWEKLKTRLDASSGNQRHYIENSDDYRELAAWRERWGELHDKLTSILEPEEFRSMSKSILNAHYTSLPIIDALWKIAERLGFKGGKALETSVGGGYFVGRQPKALADASDWSAIELDDITARIFSKLYPEAHINGNAPKENRRVNGQGFQGSSIPNNSVDMVIGNFPFDDLGPNESMEEFGMRMNLHNYFFARSIDKIRPGGLIVAITSASTMDNNLVQRELLAGRAELVGAIRLPNTAFKDSAGTEVTTDILILRKKDGSRDVGGESWLHTESVGTDVVAAKQRDADAYTWLSSIPAEWVPVDESLKAPWKEWRVSRPKTGDKWKDLTNAINSSGYKKTEGIRFSAPIEVNQYFANHPEMVIGKHALAGTMYSPGEYAVVPDGQDLMARMEDVIGNLPQDVLGENVEAELEKIGNVEAETGDRDGSTVERNGKVYQVVKRQLVPVRWDVEVLENIIDGHPILKGNKALRAEFNTVSSEGSAEELDVWLRKTMAEKMTKEEIEKTQKKVEAEVAKRRLVFSSWAKVRDTARELVNAELNDLSDEKTEALRGKLNETYDAHVAKFGAFNKRGPNPHKFLADDEDTPLLDSLEDEELVSTDAKGKPVYRYVKRPIFTKSQLSKTTAPESAADIKEAVGISLGFLGRLSLPYMSKLLGVTESEVKATLEESGLALINPRTGMYESADMYLSGEVRAKLREAEKANLESGGQYERNIELLKAALPDNRPIHSISIVMGARWIPGEVYTAFAHEVLGMDNMQISYRPEANIWRIEESGSSRNVQYAQQQDISGDQFFTDKVGVGEILDSILNKRDLTVRVRPRQGPSYVDVEATLEAKAKAEQMGEKFNEWIKSSDTTVEVDGEDVTVGTLSERLYNENVAGVVPPKFAGDWVTLPGQSGEIWLKPHRRAVLARMLTLGYGMMAHGVGSGKTYNQIALAMELRRLGKARKVMTLVQNSTIKQFAASHMKAYPQSRILVADENNFTARKRAKFQARIATGDYDSIILTHSNVALIGHDEQSIRNYMARAFDQLQQALESSEDGSSEQKDVQKAMDKLQEKLEKMLKSATARSGGLLTWEQLGIDALIVDEAHAFKNAPIVTRMSKVKNIPNGSGADQAIMMQMKVANVQSVTGGKNIFFATGTPITNTMAEAYTMLNYIAPTLLEQRGIKNFDDFATTFGRTVSEPEATWKGEIENVERFAKFVNGPELVNLIRSVFDVALGNEGLGLRVPRIKGGKPQAILIEPTEASEIFNDWIIDTAAAFAAIPNKRKAFEETPWMSAIPIMTMQAGMAQAIDPRLINPNVPDDPDSKVNKVVDEVYRIYRQGQERKTAQVIFSDLSNPFSTLLLREFNGDPFEEFGSVSTEMAALENQIIAFPSGELSDQQKKDKKKLVDRHAKMVGEQFNLFDDIKQKLVAKGVPAGEIAIASSDMDRKKLQAAFEKVNNGSIRVIMGSTARLGVGVNIQERLAGCHNLSPPRDFKPAMMEQRIGRIERQGNLHRDWADTAYVQTVEKYGKVKFDAKKLEDRYEQAVKWLAENDTKKDLMIRKLAEDAAAEFEVDVINYGLKLSMDSAVYAMMKAKQGFIEQVLMGENVLDEFDDPASEEGAGFALMAAEAMGNEDLKTKVSLGVEIQKLQARRNGFMRDQWNREATLKSMKDTIARYSKKDPAAIREAGKEFEGVFSRVKRTIKTTKGAIAKSEGREISEDEAKQPAERTEDAAVYRFGDQEIDTGKSGAKIIEPLTKFLVDTHIDAVTARTPQNRDIFVNGVRFVVSVTNNKEFSSATIKVSWPQKFPGGDALYESVSSWRGADGNSLLRALRDLSEPGMTERYARSIERTIEQNTALLGPLEEAVRNQKGFPEEEDYRAKSLEMIQVDRRLSAADADPRNHRYYRALKRIAGEKNADIILGLDGATEIPKLPQESWNKIHTRLRVERRSGDKTKSPEAITKFIRDAVRVATSQAQAEADRDGPRLSAAPLSDSAPASRDAKMVRILQKRIDRAYETGKTDGVEEFESRLETLLERMDTDSAAMDEGSEEGWSSGAITENDAANPDPGSDLISAWLRWTGRGQINARDMADNRAEFPNFGQFYRSVIGDGAFAVQEGITDKQIEEAAKEAAGAYEARRRKMGGLKAAPLSDSETPENIRRLTAQGRKTMADAETEAEARRQQEAFADQGKVIGTPRLANISDDEAVRGEMDVIDEMRKFTATRQKKTTWERDGRALADADENAVVENWLANAFSDEGQAIQAKDVVAARIVMERRVKTAGNDLDKHADNAVLLHGYREARANQARVLAAGTDPFKNPEERYRDYLAGVIYELPPRVISAIEDRARTPAAAREAIRKAVRARLETVEKALKKLGVTLDEITGGQVFLSLSQTAVMKDTLSRLTPAEKTAVKAIQAGGTVADVRRKSGLSDERIQALAAQVRKELADKLRAKVAAGLKLEDLKDEMKGLRAAALSAADIEAELERILTVGFGIPETVPTARLPKKKRTKPQPLEKTDWNRPVFTDALASFAFDTKDRSEIMARVVTLRDIAGADGRIATLTGDKKAKAVRLVGEINRVLAKYSLTADKVLKEGTDPDSYRFDITDRVHVMILARTIRALDADIVDKGTEFYYSSILSGLQTMAVNAFGAVNTFWQATVERGFEAAVNLVVNDPSLATFSEGKYMLKAMGPMLSRAWGNAVATWQAETPFFEEDILGRAPDASRIMEGTTGYRTGSISGTKGRIIRTPGRILMMTDEFMNTARAVVEVGAMAYRFAVANGHKPGTPEFDKVMKQQVNVPGSEAWQMAAQRALVGTFNNALPTQKDVTGEEVPLDTLTDLVGGGIAVLSKWARPSESDNLSRKMLKVIPRLLFFPFVRVPYNILKQGVERSLNPISLIDMGLLFGHNLRFRDGKFTINASGGKARIIEGIAKQLQGSLIMLLLAGIGEGDDDDLEKTIVITGSRPFGDTKKGERELGYRIGLGPYEISMKLPGGKRVGFSYGRIEPAATVLGSTIDTLRGLKTAGKGRITYGEAASSMLFGLVSQANDKTSLRGASDLMSILRGDKPLDRFTADRIGGIMPNIIKQAVRESDEYFREKPDDFFEMIQRAIVPYGGDPAFTVYGDPQKKKGNSASRILDFTDFGGEAIRPYDEMLWRYKQKNPNPKVFYAPESPSGTYTIKGDDKKMNAAQAARFKEAAGKRTLVRLKATPLNLTNPQAADIKRFKDAVDAGRDDARKILFNSPAWQNLK